MLPTAGFFADLPAEDLLRLEQAGRIDTHPSRSIIFAEGDAAESVYVVLRGEVLISHKEVDLTTVGEGDLFGEMALFDGAPRSATASAVGDTRLFVLGRKPFFEFLSRSPDSIARLFSRLSSKMRLSNERVLQTSLEKERVRTEMERDRYRSLAELVAGVAHEINTPLGIIQTATGVISDRLASAEAEKMDSEFAADLKEAGALIDANLARVNKLVQSFKNLSAAQMVDEMQEVNLADVIDDTLTVFKPVARRARLEIDVAASRALPWKGYPGFLSQIVLNLLTNIERYAYPDGVGGRVEIRIVEIGDRYRIEVRDFGAGIPPENLPRIFEPFFTSGRARGGTGLGMAIVHNLVTNALKGEIALDSKPGNGTTVTVTIPKTPDMR